MAKTYIFDTNVLISDPDSIWMYEGDIVIPLAVIKELDSLKSRADEVGYKSRIFSRALDNLCIEGNISEGISVGTGVIKIDNIDPKIKNKLPEELRDLSHADNAVIALGLQYKNLNKKCIVVSNDINVRIQANFLGLTAESHNENKISSNADEAYGGVKKIEVNNDIIDQFYKDGFCELNVADIEVYPNEFIIMKSSDKSAIGRLSLNKDNSYIIKSITDKDAFGLKPRNKEQQFALDLLLDPSIKLVSLTGLAGSGKTIMAISAGLQQVLEDKKYEKLIISKSIFSVGKEIGWLPGDLQEKMAPWIQSYIDNLSFLFNRNSNKAKIGKKKDPEPYLSLYFEKGTIEVEAISFIRGRSISNGYMILDEAQNNSLSEIKTVITRVGEGTKIVLIGDITQIDNHHLDEYSNGLSRCIEKFKKYSISGHITLKKGERSELATIASQIL